MGVKRSELSPFQPQLLLLERGEGLEELGEVDVRVAAGGQGFLGHLPQPAIHVLLLVPGLQATCRGQRRSRK